MIKSFCLKKAFLLLTGIFFISGIIQAQTIAISGEVADASTGELLPGVSVVIKGTTTGSITNFDGVYNLNTTAGDVIVYSFIGYVSQEITIGQQSTLNVQLAPDVVGVDEVVVIGYGSVKKEDATGSVVAISAKDFNQGAITSPQDLMVGKTSGVQITSSGGAPGAGSTIRIRGGASLNASNDPLFVIDGVPVASGDIKGMANPLSTVNPDDIETFTVLKDASATAIYGSRASNGVIIITTKKGKGDQPLSVSYTSKYSVSTVSKNVDVYDASEYKQLLETLPGVPAEAMNSLGESNTDWQDEIYKSAFGTDQNISFSGGVKGLPYRISLGYNNQDGVLKTSNIQRTSLNLNLNPEFFDGHLKTNVSLKGSLVNNSFANEGAIGSAIGFDPTQSVYSGNDTWGGYWQWVDDNNLPLSFAPQNPVALLNQQQDKSDVSRGIANLKLDYKLHFFPDVNVVVNMGIDYADSDGKKIIDKDAIHAYSGENARGEIYKYDETKTNKVLDTYAQYNKTFGIHALNVMAGYSWQHFHTEGYENRNNLDGTSTTPVDRAYAGENFLVSFYGRANYTLNSKYLFTATVRQDGTSRFNPDGSNQWGTFPSGAFAWKIREESFLSNADKLSDLKLRLGWGVTGQQDINGQDYVGYPTYTLSDNGARYIFGDRWFNTYRPNGYNKDLKWEETTSTNVGIDFGFWNNRLLGSVDYYYRKTDDLLNEVTVAAGTNLRDKVFTNIGSLENEGVELNLTGRIISKQDLYWEVGTNFTMNRNEITSLSAIDDPNFRGYPTGDVGEGRNVQINAVGRPSNSFYMYQQVYGNDGKPLEGVYEDQNGDGLINSEDRIYYGDPNPDVLIGLNSRLNYKDWDFSFSGRFQLGAQIYNQVNMGGANYANIYNPTTSTLSNKLKAAETTGFLEPDERRVFSSHWIENADFFRLDNVSVGYNFTDVFGVEKSNLRLYLTGQNLFVISSYSGLDPEVFNGRDNSIFPRPSTVMFGLNFGF